MSHSVTCHQDPRNILAYAQAGLIEQVMALHGRGSSDPKRYRRLLESMDIPALQRALDVPPDFPATSLTENAGVIARADTGTPPGSALDVNSQPETQNPKPVCV